MQTELMTYQHDGVELEAFVAYKTASPPRPLVLIAHAWEGRSEFVMQKARYMAELGYVGFALDMYGQGQVGQSVEENMALMQPIKEHRALLASRMQLALETGRALPYVDANRVAAIGFCFGGLCVLDLARSGADVNGVVSFHGLLDAPEKTADRIQAKVLVLHGYADPMVPPEQVQAFSEEMTRLQADWQIHTYGQAKHAFTNPNANDHKLGTVYNTDADHRAWESASIFLESLLSNQV